jgi:thiamine-phosphate pyrophosphorylase
MPRPALPVGLYVITDSQLIPAGELVARVSLAIQGGAAIIQYRDKQQVGTARRREVAALATLCRAHHTPLIINDDTDLAAAVGASGVHLGKTDRSIRQARETLGPAAIIGVSCYNDLERASVAAQAGADYVAFGRFFPSTSKPDAIQADPALLTRARQQLDLPSVAIGGITPENGAPLIAAGADLLAVIHGVFGQPDISKATARYTRLFHCEGAAEITIQ